MEVGMGSMRAALEEVTAAKVPEIDGLESAAQKKWLAEEGGLREEVEEVEEINDFLGFLATEFRDSWNKLYGRYYGRYGRFEDTTKIPNKLFTYRKPSSDASPRTALQVFAVKITKVKVGLQWPLHVFGMVAIRDCLDERRNIIFDRPRHNCQIITREDPYLKLTGPTRIVVMTDPATFEVDLKVKGTTGSEDKLFSFLAVTYCHFSRCDSHLLKMEYESKLSELEFHLGSIIDSVEATIEVRITSGSWPNGLRAQFTAGTTGIPGAEVILLDSGDNDRPPIARDGTIKLSRCVVSVEVKRKLRVWVKAFLGDKIVENKSVDIEAKTANVTNRRLSVDFYRLISESMVSKSKTKIAGKGDGPVGLNHEVGSLGCCNFDFNISWSII